jgi:hypothetical protein
MAFDLTSGQKNALQIGGVVLGAIGLIYAISHHGNAVTGTDGVNPIVLGGSSGGSGVAGLNPITGNYGGVDTPNLIYAPPPSVGAVATQQGNNNTPSTCCPGITSVQYTTSGPIGPPVVVPADLPPDNPSILAYPSQGPNLFDEAFGQGASQGGGPFAGDIAQAFRFG